MKTSNSAHGVLLLALFLCFVPILSSAQTVIRQSVGTIGGSSQVEGVLIQSATGQSFNTSTTNAFRPGFIQPNAVITSPSSLSMNLKVFPNPASNNITVQSDEGLEGYNVRVIDLHGKLIHEINQNPLQEINIDCSAWNKGTYFISVYGRRTKVHTSKLIVNN